LGGPFERRKSHFLGEIIRDGADPRDIGHIVCQAAEGERFYIFTHPETAAFIKRRHKAIMHDFA